jgi:hypothetical protein
MARIRSIHPGVFTDEAFASLSMSRARATASASGRRLTTTAFSSGSRSRSRCGSCRLTTSAFRTCWQNASARTSLNASHPARVTDWYGTSAGIKGRKSRSISTPCHPSSTLYAGLKPDGSLQVLHQSRTGGESGPQREDGGGEGEEESGSGIEKGEGVGLARADLKLVEEGQPIPINESYQPSDRAIEYAYSLGMKKADLNSELSKFIALSMASRAKSYNPDMSFKAFCDRWLDFKRNKDPNWKPAPEAAAAAAAPQEPFVLVVYGTIEAAAWDHYLRSKGLRPLFFCKHIVDGVEVVAARCPTLVPPGYDEATGEKMAPANEEDAA